MPPAFHKFIGKEVFEGQVKGRDDPHLCGLLPCCFPHPPLVSVVALLPLVSKSFFFSFFFPLENNHVQPPSYNYKNLPTFSLCVFLLKRKADDSATLRIHI